MPGLYCDHHRVVRRRHAYAYAMHREVFTDAATAPAASGASYSAASPDTAAASSYNYAYRSAAADSASSHHTGAAATFAASYSGAKALEDEKGQNRLTAVTGCTFTKSIRATTNVASI